PGTPRPCASDEPTVRVVHVHDCAPVGTKLRPLFKSGTGQTEQSNVTFAGRLRSAPIVVTCPLAGGEGANTTAGTSTRSRIRASWLTTFVCDAGVRPAAPPVKQSSGRTSTGVLALDPSAPLALQGRSRETGPHVARADP